MSNKNVFYHYCSLDTFQKIIEGKTIRLCNITKMNDSTEGKDIEKYASKQIQLLRNNGFTFIDDSTIYISCFSRKKDLLSQWRAYGDDGFGVAIGFDFDELGIPKLVLNQDDQLVIMNYLAYGEVIYNNSNKENIIKTININVRERKVNSDGVPINAALITNLQSELLKCKPIYKDEYFSEEDEVRIIYSVKDASDIGSKPFNIYKTAPYKYKIEKGIEFYVSKNELIDYVNLNISEDGETLNSSLIKEIVLGPKSKMDKDDMVLKNFMKANGLSNTLITKSEGSYR